MAPASTGDIDAETFETHFGCAVKTASIATTEISQVLKADENLFVYSHLGQVPLSGVTRLLDIARNSPNKTLSMLDIDVPPSVAAGDAQLGTHQEVFHFI